MIAVTIDVIDHSSKEQQQLAVILPTNSLYTLPTCALAEFDLDETYKASQQWYIK